MKARYLTAKETRIIKQVATQEAERQMQDIAKRCQYLWMAAMLDTGLSVKTVNRVAATLTEITDRYSAYREEGVADFALYTRLKEAGVDVEMTDDEL